VLDESGFVDEVSVVEEKVGLIEPLAKLTIVILATGLVTPTPRDNFIRNSG